MNKVSIFEHPEFGRIRTLEIDGKIWFCASDVAAALGYSNPRDAVVRHCKPMGVVVYDTPTRSAVQKIRQAVGILLSGYLGMGYLCCHWRWQKHSMDYLR